MLIAAALVGATRRGTAALPSSLNFSIPPGAVGEDLTDFPVFVDLSLLPSSFWDTVQSDGGDLKVTSDDGETRYPLELVSINAASKTGSLWFLAPSVPTAGVTYTLWFGGEEGQTQPAADAEFGSQAVWADYAVVWHTATDPGSDMPDSTGNGNDGTVSGSPTLVTDDGPYGAALDVGKNDGIGNFSPVVPDAPVSWSWWTKHDSVGEDGSDGYFGVGSHSSLNANSVSYLSRFSPLTSNGRVQNYASDGTTWGSWSANGAISEADVWFKWHAVNADGIMTLYKNGAVANSGSIDVNATARDNPIVMSRISSSNVGLAGRMAEFRIRGDAVSAAWEAAEYLNATQTAFFLGIGEGQFHLYVATTGDDDTGDGTEGNPYATIEKAASEASPGTTIHVAAGTYEGQRTHNIGGSVAVYTNASGTQSSPIRFVSDTPWGAVIDGAGVDQAWHNAGDYVEVIGFEITGSNYVGFNQRAHYGLIAGNHIHDLAAPDVNVPNGGALIAENKDTSSNNRYIGNLVHGVNPPGANSTMHGIYVNSPGFVVQNNIVYDVSDTARGIQAYRVIQDGIISNNLVFDCGNGILYNPSEVVGSQNAIITNNIVIDCGIGIRKFGDDPTVTIDSNITFNCSTDYYNDGDAIDDTVATNRITSNPGLVNYQQDGSGDYHLAAGSPAIGQGTSNGAPEKDFDGVTRGSPPDIGPYEYVA